MRTWLDNAAKKVSIIAPETIYQPEEEIDPDNDHVLGVASEDAQRLFTLAIRLMRASKEREIIAQFDPSPAVKKQALKEVFEYRKKADHLFEAFWITILDDFQIWDRSKTGIRKGWKIVWAEVEETQSIDLESLLNKAVAAAMAKTPAKEPKKKEKKEDASFSGWLLRLLNKRLF